MTSGKAAIFPAVVMANGSYFSVVVWSAGDATAAGATAGVTAVAEAGAGRLISIEATVQSASTVD